MELTKDLLYKEYIVSGKSERALAEELNVSIGKVDYWIGKYGLNYKTSNPDKVLNLSNISKNDPIFCYFAGLMATDGYIDYKNHRASVRVGNEGSYEVFSKLLNYFKYRKPVRVYKRNSKDLNDITIPSNLIIKELDSMGIRGKKDTRSYSLDWYLSASDDCKMMFLRGVSDGDGNFHKGVFRLAMKSQGFVENLIKSFNLLTNDVYVLRYTSNSSGTKYPNITLHKKDTKEVFSKIYKGYDDYRFTDKYTKLCEQVGDIV